LGRMVATDHVAVQQMGRDLARKLRVTPTPPDNDTSVADYARTVALLQSKSGADFDKAYLQYEVAFHQSVVDAIKDTLLPAATNAELRKLLNTVLNAISPRRRPWRRRWVGCERGVMWRRRSPRRESRRSTRFATCPTPADR